MLQFRDNAFANPEGLIAFISEQGASARVRPDMKVVLFYDWEKPAAAAARHHRGAAQPGADRRPSQGGAASRTKNKKHRPDVPRQRPRQSGKSGPASGGKRRGRSQADGGWGLGGCLLVLNALVSREYVSANLRVLVAGLGRCLGGIGDDGAGCGGGCVEIAVRALTPTTTTTIAATSETRTILRCVALRARKSVESICSLPAMVIVLGAIVVMPFGL